MLSIFLSTFQELNCAKRETYLHRKFSQVYFHIDFQLFINKPFPKDTLPSQENVT